MAQARRVAMAGLATVLLGLLACPGAASADEQDGVLRIGYGASLRSLDPAGATGRLEMHVVEACFEGLVFIDPETFEPVPGAAASWTVSEDQRTWTFRLRADAGWSDGSSVTAQDFAASLRRALDPDLGSDMAYLLYGLRGARAFSEYPGAVAALRGDDRDAGLVRKLAELVASASDGLDREGWRRWLVANPLPDVLSDAPEPLVRAAFLGDRTVWSGEQLATLARSLGAAAERLEVAHVAARRAFGRTQGVVAVDEHTLRLELERPQAWLLHVLASSVASPLPAQFRERSPYGFRRPDGSHEPGWWASGSVPVNGPFRIASFEADPKEGGRCVRLERNEAYWNAKAVRQPVIEVILSTDPAASLRRFTEGRLDWTSDWPREVTPALRAGDVLREGPSNIVYFYDFNCRHPALRDARVRRALARAVDREALLRAVPTIAGRPAESLVPPLLPSYPGPGQGLTFDPVAARALLARTAFGSGKALPELEILYNTSVAHHDIAEFVAGQWRRHLGVRVRTRNADWQEYLQRRRSGDFAVCRMGWIGDYPDPLTFLELFETGRPGNPTGWADAEFDALLEEAREELDAGRRLDLLAQAERRMLLEGVPCVPFYWYVLGELVQPWVHGFRMHATADAPGRPGPPNAQGIHPLRGLWIERKPR